jgi:hypothetical protein
MATLSVTVANGEELVRKALENFRQNDYLTRAHVAEFIEKMGENKSDVIQLHHGTVQHPGDLFRDEVILMNEGVVLHRVPIGDYYRKQERPVTNKPEWSKEINWDRKFKDGK